METQRSNNLSLYNTLTQECADLESKIPEIKSELETINNRVELIKALLRTYDSPKQEKNLPTKGNHVGFVPGIKPQVIEYILNSPVPLTNTEIQKEFNVPDDQKGNFGSMLKTLRGNGTIVAIKYEDNNVLTFYGNPSKAGTTDFIDTYKTEQMIKLRNPKRI